MKWLYAPWRQKYSESVDKTKKENADPKDCIFCTHITDNADEKNFILRRFKHNYIMMNLYPYNAGHLLIVPYKHVAELHQLNQQERHELIHLINESTIILGNVLHAQGINVGLNIGKEAGAGIPAHIHFHVLPRWRGDTNFMPTLADTKHISFDLKQLYQQLKPAFEALKKIDF